MDGKVIQKIEEAFSQYLIGNLRDKDLEETLVTYLQIGLSNKKFSISIDTKKGNQFYGMNVYPSPQAIEEICDKVCNSQSMSFIELCKRWEGIEEWVIIIDPKCFDRNYINFNPSELTAMLLHEVGHVIISDQPIESFYRAYREANLQMKTAEKTSKKIFYMFYTIPLAIACSQKFWFNGKNDLKLEMKADKTLLQTGYAEHLVSAFDKIIKVIGSTNNTNDNRQYEKVYSSCIWCNQNVIDVSKRRDMLKDELYYIGIRNQNAYISARCYRVLDFLGARLRERYTGAVVESFLETTQKIDSGEIAFEQYILEWDPKRMMKLENLMYGVKPATEGVLNRRKNYRLELPSQYDIDRIAVEIDKIENHYDRVYVLDMIYAQIERLNDFEEAISFDKQKAKSYAGRIKQMREELAKLREITLAKKNLQKDYKLFVRLPAAAADYEG